MGRADKIKNGSQRHQEVDFLSIDWTKWLLCNQKNRKIAVKIHFPYHILNPLPPDQFLSQVPCISDLFSPFCPFLWVFCFFQVILALQIPDAHTGQNIECTLAIYLIELKGQHHT